MHLVTTERDKKKAGANLSPLEKKRSRACGGFIPFVYFMIINQKQFFFFNKITLIKN